MLKQVIDEKILLYRIRSSRDEDAFAQIYDLYVSSIYRFVYFKVGSKEEAEDVVSEVFLKIWNYLTNPDNRDVGNIRQLLYSIARNLVVDVYRRRARHRERALTEALPVVDPRDIAETFETKQSVDDILVQLKRLKQEYQEVIFLRYIEELSLRDIAAVLDKSGPSVRVLLHRATKKLKEISLE